MTEQNSSKRSEHNLKQILEIAVDDLFQLTARGLKLTVNDMKAMGQPIHRINATATLFFLPKGSPFCCLEPGCHLGFFITERRERLNQRIAHDLKLTQIVEVNFESITQVTIGNTYFDSPIPPGIPSDINMRDGLGRTALIRAAQRDYTDLFEKLIEAGADMSIRDDHGKTALDYLGKDHWLQKLYGPQKQ